MLSLVFMLPSFCHTWLLLAIKMLANQLYCQEQENGSAIYFVLKTGEVKLAATVARTREGNMVVTVG